MKLSEVFSKSQSSAKEEKKPQKPESDSPSGSAVRRLFKKKGAAAEPAKEYLRGEPTPTGNCIHIEHMSDNTEYPGTPISKTSSGSSSDPKTSPAPETAPLTQARNSSEAPEASRAESSEAQSSSQQASSSGSQDSRPAVRSHFGFHAPFRSSRAGPPPYNPPRVYDPAVQPGTSRPIVYVGGHWTGGFSSAVPF